MAAVASSRPASSAYSPQDPGTPTQQPAVIVDRNSGKSYIRGRFLGKGGFAKCYELTDADTNQLFAGKIVAKATLTKHRAKEKLSTEIKIHRSLDHKNVVKFHRFFEDKDYVYILLELCSNKSLMELHKRRRALTEAETRFYMIQILEATEYMHSNKVIHRDLKLGNLFLNEDMQVKVGDFGLATTVAFEGERKKTLCGTPNYIAPEILDGKNGHSFEVDIWSIGCILYTMLIGRPPFETSNIKTTYRKIKTNDYKIPSTVVISEDAKALIRATLNLDPTARPTVSEIKTHPFFTAAFIPETLPASSLSIPPTFTAAQRKNTLSKEIGGTERRALGVLNSPSIGSDAPMAKPLSHAYAHGSAAASALASDAHTHRPRAAAVSKAASEAAPLVVPAPHMPSSRSGSVPSLAVSHSPDSLNGIHQLLVSVTTRQMTAAASGPIQTAPTSEARHGICISKWVDYSNKYGLGYQLSDHSVGVLFNDSTKMILAPDNTRVEFIERDSVGGATTVMTMSDYPEALQKKITLLKYFRNYMTEHLLNGGEAMEVDVPHAHKASLSHVQKWVRTKHAIVFRLSGGVIQINFFDHTKLILNAPRGLVTFINKERVTKTYFLEDLARANHASVHELVSRLSYATDVVEHMLKSASRGTSSA